MDNNQLINSLTIVLGIMLGILVILSIVFLVITIKNRKPKNKENKSKHKVGTPQEKGKNGLEEIPQSYTKESIFKFMEFDKIEDNMIVQKGGKRYVMVIGCQGINFDLMSGLEKNSVEQGFLQFLNTLRYPIQIYVQTRTVNLEKSISGYKDRVESIGKDYANKQMEYTQMTHSGRYTEKEIQDEKREVARLRNLYEYGLDIVSNTEMMSLNRNILSKNYYVIISYYPEEGSNSNYAPDEIMNLAFSELYTKAQSIINSLGVCGVNGKILDSMELADLVYVAYNRDESDRFDLKRALNAGYEDLYSTAPDVFDKRMKELDIRIEKEAVRKANDAIKNVVEESEKERRAKEKEARMDQLISQMAKTIIEQNKRSIGPDIAEEAEEKIDKEAKKLAKEKKGGKDDGKEERTTATRRTTGI